MERTSIPVLFLVLRMSVIVTIATAAQDYCKMACGEQHLACQYNDTFAENCGNSIRLVDMKKISAMILKLHNVKRNEVASGRGEFPLAKQLSEMVWGRELAYLAQVKVKQCRQFEDTCRSTSNFPTPGISSSLTQFPLSNSDSDSKIIHTLMRKWFNEFKYLTPQMIQTFPSDETIVKQVENSARIISANNTRIGCAATVFEALSMKNFLFTCLYSGNLTAGMSLYTIGNGTIECNSGFSKTYINLCSPKEQIGNTTLQVQNRPISRAKPTRKQLFFDSYRR